MSQNDTTIVRMTPGDYSIVPTEYLQEIQAEPKHRPVHDDIDRARFAAELLRDRLEVLVAYGAKALTSVLDELEGDDTDWILVRMAL